MRSRPILVCQRCSFHDGHHVLKEREIVVVRITDFLLLEQADTDADEKLTIEPSEPHR
jgi:hypothetical protein